MMCRLFTLLIISVFICTFPNSFSEEQGKPAENETEDDLMGELEKLTQLVSQQYGGLSKLLFGMSESQSLKGTLRKGVSLLRDLLDVALEELEEPPKNDKREEL
ncbi:hypothetical protein EG68_03068 [Paragonimus skrjabini miyazakii]|uniref:Uncharacterized protein n=1 Tax=Paragonimus skrjabini miyazakii TaxID=59628 RepID=A0A8S9Z2L0_9TREM|nr:hypothetical protein EG68_03068 [Paragonimus skrjabini miyazakii]